MRCRSSRVMWPVWGPVPKHVTVQTGYRVEPREDQAEDPCGAQGIEKSV